MAAADAELIGRLRGGFAVLSNAVTNIEDEFYGPQVKLAASVLGNAIGAATSDLNPRTVQDLDFAYTDLRGLADELGGNDRSSIDRFLSALSTEIERLKAAVSLPEEVTQSVSVLQKKLKERRSAVERQTYRVPGTAPEPIPHPPAELQPDAESLQKQLTRFGYDTPTLNRLVSSPADFEIRDVSELIEELDVILG